MFFWFADAIRTDVKTLHFIAQLTESSTADACFTILQEQLLKKNAFHCLTMLSENMLKHGSFLVLWTQTVLQ